MEGAIASAAPVTAELMNLENEPEKLQKELKVISVRQTQIESLKFGFHQFIGSDNDMNYYTGISSRHFLALFMFLNAGDFFLRLRCRGSDNSCIEFPKVDKKRRETFIRTKR